MVAKRVAIVGGGLSGAAMLCTLLDQGAAAEITVYEPAEEIGPGLAYGAAAPWHLLNVVATRASLLADDPDHAWRWARQHGVRHGWPDAYAFGSDSYLPRSLFGRYIVAHVAAAMARSAIPVIHRRIAVTDIAQDGAGLQVTAADGGQAAFDAVILAVGAREAPAPPIEGLASARLVTDPWRLERLRGIAPDAGVLILGSALTMADTVLSLHRLGHRGPIHVLSRRGLVPQARRNDAAKACGLDADAIGLPLSQMLHRLRRAVADAGGEDWQAVFEGLRPITNTLWVALPDESKRRFQRHLRGIWDVHRFRMPPSTAELLQTLTDEGRLQFHKGHGLRIAGTTLTWRPRGQDRTRELQADTVIDCTGPRRTPYDWKARLIDHLMDQGLLASHRMGAGLAATAQGAAIDPDDRIVPGVFLLGPPMRGALLECSAISDIRGQASRLAALIAPVRQPVKV